MKEKASIPRTITINVHSQTSRDFAKAWGIKPLDQVVAKAVKVLDSAGLDANWLARVSLRAVAEAVIREGHIPMPLGVGLGFAEYKYKGPSGTLPLGQRITKSFTEKSGQDENDEIEAELKANDTADNYGWIDRLPVHKGFDERARSVGLERSELAYLLCYAAYRYPLLARFVLRFRKVK